MARAQQNGGAAGDGAAAAGSAAAGAGTAAAELSGPAQHGVELYRRMRVIRRFEETVQSLFQKGEVHGTTHLYIGEEAGAVGVGDVLGEHDRVAGTYRGHGHALAVGVDPQALLDEMLGRASGVCGGRAGSMNVIDLEHRLIGSFGIIGGSISAATGAALALKRQGKGGVAVAFFGEGTTNHGYFHECLNFAAVRELPVLFVCENNRYGEFTPFEDVTAGEIAARPRALGIAEETVDGMDVWAVREAAEAALRRARDGEGPQFIQSMTYRFVGHSRSDPGAYRKPGELEEWKQRDPLLVARAKLTGELGVEATVLDGVERAVEEQFEAIVERALAAPYPDPARDAAREFAPTSS
jgi:TPP-dependent pyruvate/acetoin dehydrogenase alpha subunit